MKAHIAPKQWPPKRPRPAWKRILFLLLLLGATIGLCVWAPWETDGEEDVPDNCKLFVWTFKAKTTWSVCCPAEGEDMEVIQCEVVQITAEKTSGTPKPPSKKWQI